MKILVTGSNGQLGSELRLISTDYNKYNWVFTDIDELNLVELNSIKKKISDINPDVIINCAAYTDVDGAEKNKNLSNIINFKSVDVLSKWTFLNKKKIIHISTDYVFDGKSKVPLMETFKTNPINFYGKSKLKGDKICQINDKESIILRTSWVYSVYGKNFVKTMLNLMQNSDSISVVDDQISSPTYAADLANAIMVILNSKKWIPGIYNFSNEGKVSWFDFAKKIREICGFNVNIYPVKSKYFSRSAKRPKFTMLDKSKIKKTYNLTISNYENSLKKCLSILTNEK
jgi:dTDP-4-dehydrorhamnose reductase